MSKEKLEETEEQLNNQEETPQDEQPQEEETTLKVEVEEDPVEKLEAELAEQKDKFLRLYSEFENYKRRTSKEKLELIQTANSGLMEVLIPVLDDFERAIAALEKDSKNNSENEGIVLVAGKFKKALEQKGLKVMQHEIGGDFDTDYHEAITQIPAPEEKLKGKIVDIIEKGYLLGEKVIRYAKVVTGK